MTSFIILGLLLILCICGCHGKETLRLCEANEDSFGDWKLSSSVHSRDVMPFFVNSYYGEAVYFDKMWLPGNCSYLRFTNASLQAVATHLIRSGKANSKEGKLRLLFMGDSATRGIFCGIGRILSGSERYGPNINMMCGSPESPNPKSSGDLHKLFDIEFGNFVLSFMFIQRLGVEQTAVELVANVRRQPYAFIFNTGAWDFAGSTLARVGYVRSNFSDDGCDTAEDTHEQLQRVNDKMKGIFAEAGRIGHDLNVKMIYRTTHHNIRYGVQCSDGLLIPILKESMWRVWDNTRVSKSVWRTQNHDGFHFDRMRTHNVTQHYHQNLHAKQNHIESPGMMEIQLAQSLLHFIFRDTVQEFLDKGAVLPI